MGANCRSWIFVNGVRRFGPFALFAGSLWVDVLFERLFKSLDVIFTRKQNAKASAARA